MKQGGGFLYIGGMVMQDGRSEVEACNKDIES